MSVNYSITMLSNPKDPKQPKKAYAKAQIDKEVSLKELSLRIASQTTVSRADVSAVLISAVDNTFDILRAGDQVSFGDLGKFRLQLSSDGAVKAEDFTATNITGVRIQFVPGDDLKTLFSGMSFAPVPSRAAVRAVLRAEKTGQTNVDLSKKPGGNTPENPDENPDIL